MGVYRMKHGMKFLAFSLAALMAVTLSACSPKQEETKTPKAVLRVGMECAYAPFNWTQSDNSNDAVAIEGGGFAGGYDVEIAKKIAESLGRELVIVKTEWDGLEMSLNSGMIDAIIAGMSPTEDRKARIDFTDSYYTSDLVIVVRKGSDYENATSLADFKDAKLTAQLNTFHYTVLEQIEGVNKQTALADFPTMITALSSGMIDGYISERPGALAAMVANGDLTFVGFEEGSGFEASKDDLSIAVGLKKDSDLREGINAALAGISEEDRAAIMDRMGEIQPVAEAE